MQILQHDRRRLVLRRLLDVVQHEESAVRERSLDEGGLADARFAGNQDDVAKACFAGADGGLQLLSLALPSDQRRRACGHGSTKTVTTSAVRFNKGGAGLHDYAISAVGPCPRSWARTHSARRYSR